MLAIANEAGLHAIGVDLSRTRCRRAERLTASGFRASRRSDHASSDAVVAVSSPAALLAAAPDTDADDDADVAGFAATFAAWSRSG